MLTVTFDKAVAVNTAGGVPALTLNSGGHATYVSGSGTTVLQFHYTVLLGENSARLDYAFQHRSALGRDVHLFGVRWTP